MNTHESYVSLDTAKLLREAGFNLETEFGQHIWDRGKRLETNRNFNSEKYLVSLPTLDVAQRWLREVKNIDVYIFPTTNTLRECVYQVGIKTFGRTLWIPGQPSTAQHDIYEEAQEAGIKKALEIILEKGE